MAWLVRCEQVKLGVETSASQSRILNGKGMCESLDFEAVTRVACGRNWDKVRLSRGGNRL